MNEVTVLRQFYNKGVERLAQMNRFPVPVGLSVILCLVWSFFLLAIVDKQPADTLWYTSFCGALACTLVLSLVGQYVWQLYRSERPIPIIAYAAIPMAVILYTVWFLNVPSSPGYRYLHIAGICLAEFAVFIGILSRYYGEGLWNYLVWAGLKCIALGSVVLMALGLCFIAWNTLLFPLPGLMPFVLFHIAFGIVAFWAFLAYLPAPDEEITGAPLFGIVLYRALYPLYIGYILILYTYIALIFSRGTLPVGQMNWFASIALSGYVFLYMTCRAYKNQPWLSPYLKYGGLLLLPIVASQIWCVYVRFVAYGLTPLRYVAMVCTIFGIVTILGALRSIRNSWLCFVGAVFVCILSITPWNVYDVPYNQQVHRLYAELELHDMVRDGKIVVGEPLSDTASDQVASAYEYVQEHHIGHDNPKGEVILHSTVLRDIALVQKSRTVTYYARKGHPIALQGFAKLYPVDAVTENGLIKVETEDGTQSFYLEDYADTLLDTYPDIHTLDELSFEVDEAHVLYFKNFTITMDGRKEPAISAHGYLLVRE